MTEQELWKDLVKDPSNEEQHQRYANECVEYDLEKQALLRYQGLKAAYPALSEKFIKQLTTALEFKLMPASEAANGGAADNGMLRRLNGFVHSLLLTGVLSLGYGYMKKSMLEIVIGIIMIAAYLSYMVRKSFRIDGR